LKIQSRFCCSLAPPSRVRTIM